MFVRALDELERLGRIKSPPDASLRSARFLTAADGMGFSYNENKVGQGTGLVVWLKHQGEAIHFKSGKGKVADLTSENQRPLEEGVLHVVGPHGRHCIRAHSDMDIFCIISPPARRGRTM